MKTFKAPRQGGKTRLAVEAANACGGYLVVKNKQEAKRVFHNFKLDRFPITYKDVFEGMKGSYVRNIVIDNMDDFVIYTVNLQLLNVVATTIDDEFESHNEIVMDIRKRMEIERKDSERKYKALKKQLKEEYDRKEMIEHMRSIVERNGE